MSNKIDSSSSLDHEDQKKIKMKYKCKFKGLILINLTLEKTREDYRNGWKGKLSWDWKLR